MDTQAPRITVDYGIGKKVFGDDIILIVWCNFRREIVNRLNCSIVGYWWWNNLVFKLSYQFCSGRRSCANTSNKTPGKDTNYAHTYNYSAALQNSAAREAIFAHCFDAANLLFQCLAYNQLIIDTHKQQAKHNTNGCQAQHRIEESSR